MIVKNTDRKLFLNVTSTAKWDKFCCIVWHVLQRVTRSYCQVGQVLQSVGSIVKWDVTLKTFETMVQPLMNSFI